MNASFFGHPPVVLLMLRIQQRWVLIGRDGILFYWWRIVLVCIGHHILNWLGGMYYIGIAYINSMRVRLYPKLVVRNYIASGLVASRVGLDYIQLVGGYYSILNDLEVLDISNFST